MSYYANPLSSDFEANWVLGDRQHQPKFVCPHNAGRGDERLSAYTEPPYDMSGNDDDGNSTDTLTINWALNDPKNWASRSIDVASGAASASAVTAQEIIDNLNGDEIFASFFTAKLDKFDSNPDYIHRTRIVIEQNKPITEMRSYISQGRADTVINFNKFIGIAELPTFFDRHTFANRFQYTDSQNHLILLDPGSNTVDANLIDNAVDAHGVSKGFDSGTVQDDYQLLKGKSGIFTFQKTTVDGSDRITEIIEYHAGAVAGDFARKIQYSYTGVNTKPDQITEIPYTLEAGDLVTPP